MSGPTRRGPLTRARDAAGGRAIEAFFRGLAEVGRLHPAARPERWNVEHLTDVPYRSTDRHEHRLDVYRPRGAGEPRPVVLYIHGGGFRILSKETHWSFALSFAARGYLVFNINYRLSPAHPFPAALEDAAAAYTWVVEHAADYGGDPRRLVVAGESAGANLTTAITIMTTYPREEPFARPVWETGVVPRAAIPACGLLQVSDTARFARRRKLSLFVRDRIREVERGYLEAVPGELDRSLADPLVLLERGQSPERPLPPFFAGVGTADPVLDDTRRLKVALDALEVPCEVRYYPREPHAFQAAVVTPNARAYWADLAEHLERWIGDAGDRPGA